MDVSQASRHSASLSYRPHRASMLTAIIGIGWVIPSGLLMLWSASRIYRAGSPDAMVQLFRCYAATRLASLVTFAGVVGFLHWLRGAYRNLQPLGSTKLEISPRLPATGRAAVVSFLIPVVNLFRARRVMVHLWRESQPAPAGLADGTVLVGTTRLVNWWIATWVLSFIPLTPLFFVLPFWSLRWMPLLCELIHGTAALLCCVMVWTIEKRQAEQHRDIQLRQPAPPVTDQLR